MREKIAAGREVLNYRGHEGYKGIFDPCHPATSSEIRERLKS